MKSLILLPALFFSFLSAAETTCSSSVYRVTVSARNTAASLTIGGQSARPLECVAANSSEATLRCYDERYQFYLGSRGDSGLLLEANPDGTTSELGELSCN